MTTLADSKVETLTKRQKEVFDQALKGLSNEEIGEALFITEKAVKYHFSDIYKKLGVKSRSQLMSIYLGNLYGNYTNGDLTSNKVLVMQSLSRIKNKIQIIENAVNLLTEEIQNDKALYSGMNLSLPLGKKGA